MIDKVVDSSVVLAVINEEAGAPNRADFGAHYRLSTVNLSEVVARLSDFGLDDHQIDAALQELGVTLVVFDKELASQAGRLRRATRHKGLSLGDRACLALALREGLPALTADRAWATVDVGVQIELIR